MSQPSLEATRAARLGMRADGLALMPQRTLLYTAVTRAKRIVVLVGSRRALAKAVRTAGAGRRYTALAARLQRGQTTAPGSTTGHRQAKGPPGGRAWRAA